MYPERIHGDGHSIKCTNDIECLIFVCIGDRLLKLLLQSCELFHVCLVMSGGSGDTKRPTKFCTRFLFLLQRNQREREESEQKTKKMYLQEEEDKRHA